MDEDENERLLIIEGRIDALGLALHAILDTLAQSDPLVRSGLIDRLTVQLEAAGVLQLHSDAQRLLRTMLSALRAPDNTNSAPNPG